MHWVAIVFSEPVSPNRNPCPDCGRCLRTRCNHGRAIKANLHRWLKTRPPGQLWKKNKLSPLEPVSPSSRSIHYPLPYPRATANKPTERLSENLATLRATKDAEREGEAIDMVRIRAKGAEARKQAQTVRIVDIRPETVAPLGDIFPLGLARDAWRSQQILPQSSTSVVPSALLPNVLDRSQMTVRPDRSINAGYR